ncbi:MAG: hypothetical protein ACXAC8_17960, partial [Candidatus Hodarchaeales archaeon]
ATVKIDIVVLFDKLKFSSPLCVFSISGKKKPKKISNKILHELLYLPLLSSVNLLHVSASEE